MTDGAARWRTAGGKGGRARPGRPEGARGGRVRALPAATGMCSAPARKVLLVPSTMLWMFVRLLKLPSDFWSPLTIAPLALFPAHTSVGGVAMNPHSPTLAA